MQQSWKTLHRDPSTRARVHARHAQDDKGLGVRFGPIRFAPLRAGLRREEGFFSVLPNTYPSARKRASGTYVVSPFGAQSGLKPRPTAYGRE